MLKIFLQVALLFFGTEASWGIARRPDSCERVLQHAAQDFRTQARIKKAKGDTEWLESYGIPGDSEIEAVRELYESRKRLLPLVSDPAARDAAREVARADLRETSRDLTEALRDPNASIEEILVDDLVVGASVHGVIANNSLRDNGRKTLIVEATEDVGSQFRWFGDALMMNSRGRPDKWEPVREDQIAKPGKGNLNSIPGARIQTTDISGAQYPTGTDLADVLLFELQQSKPNILMGKTVTYIEPFTPRTDKEREYVRSKGKISKRVFLSDGTQLLVRDKVHVTSGLGKETVPFVSGDFGRLRADNPPGSKGQTAWFGSEFLKSNYETKGRTAASMGGKRITLIGGGDQALVILENLIRDTVLASRAGSTPMQVGGLPAEINVVGLSAKDCKDLLGKLRARYSRVTGSTRRKDGALDDAIRRIINPIEAFANLLKANESGEMTLELRPKTDGPPLERQSVDGDIVIVATGPFNNPYEVVRRYLPRTGTVNPLASDTRFNQPIVSDLPGYDLPVKLGKELVTEFGDSTGIHFWGPCAGKLAESGETEGIKENIASIFALGRRTSKGVKITSPPPETALPAFPAPKRSKLIAARSEDSATVGTIEKKTPREESIGSTFRKLNLAVPDLRLKPRTPEDILVLEDLAFKSRLESIFEKYFTTDEKEIELRWIRLEDGRYAMITEPPLTPADMGTLTNKIESDPTLVYGLESFIGGEKNELTVRLFTKDSVPELGKSTFQIGEAPILPPKTVPELGAFRRRLKDADQKERKNLQTLLPTLAESSDLALATRFVKSKDPGLRREGLRALSKVDPSSPGYVQALDHAASVGDAATQLEVVELLRRAPISRQGLQLVQKLRMESNPNVRNEAFSLFTSQYGPALQAFEQELLNRFRRFLKSAGRKSVRAATFIPREAVEFFGTICNPKSAIELFEAESLFTKTGVVGMTGILCTASLTMAAGLADIVLTLGLSREPIGPLKLLDGSGGNLTKDLIRNSKNTTCVRAASGPFYDPTGTPDRSYSNVTFAKACESAGGKGSPCLCSCKPEDVAINPWFQDCITPRN